MANKNKPMIYEASDYAGIGSKNFVAYYGYEVTDKNDEWCFKAEFNNEVIKIPFSKLGAKDQNNCQDCLLHGIGWLFAKYKLSP